MKYNLICALTFVALTMSGADALRLQAHIEDDDAPTDAEKVSIKNIYGIPSDSEKLKMQEIKLKKQKAAALAKKKKEYQDAFAAFSKTLKEDDFDRGMKLKQELLDLNQPKDALDKTKIATNNLYKKQFQFPEVAKNDFSTELFENLEIAEKNLNSNLDNVDLFNNFVETAQDVKKKLKEKYGDQWTDPAEGAPAKVTESEDD